MLVMVRGMKATVTCQIDIGPIHTSRSINLSQVLQVQQISQDDYWKTPPDLATRWGAIAICCLQLPRWAQNCQCHSWRRWWSAPLFGVWYRSASSSCLKLPSRPRRFFHPHDHRGLQLFKTNKSLSQSPQSLGISSIMDSFSVVLLAFLGGFIFLYQRWSRPILWNTKLLFSRKPTSTRSTTNTSTSSIHGVFKESNLPPDWLVGNQTFELEKRAIFSKVCPLHHHRSKKEQETPEKYI